MSNTKDLISQLQKNNKEEHISVFVPSQGAEVTFSPLTVRQQKELIKTALDGTIAGVTLNQAINDIITSNDMSNSELNIFDRYAVAIQLRAACISENYTPDGSENPVNLLKHVNDSYNGKKSVQKGKSIKLGPISVNVDVPTISRDGKVNAVFTKNVSERESAGDTISDLYGYEIVKFIRDVTVGDGESFEFGSTNVMDCVRVVDNLPAKVNLKIKKYMEDARDIENVCLSVNGEVIDIDASFFTSE